MLSFFGDKSEDTLPTGVYFAGGILSHGNALSSKLSPVSAGSWPVGIITSGVTPSRCVLPPLTR